MGVKAVFDAVKALVNTYDPTVEMLLTKEALDFHGNVNRVVWLLPGLGQENHTRDGVNPGFSSSNLDQGTLWNRRITCLIHCWIPAGGTDSDGLEYPDDNEDPNEGTVWFPAIVKNAIHEVCSPAYSLGEGGFMDRTEGNLGFAYVFSVTFDTATMRTKITGSATIETATLTGSFTT